MSLINNGENFILKGMQVARLTGLEPATPGVTGRYSNQLSYNRAVHALSLTSKRWEVIGSGIPPVKQGFGLFAIFCEKISRQGSPQAKSPRFGARAWGHFSEYVLQTWSGGGGGGGKSGLLRNRCMFALAMKLPEMGAVTKRNAITNTSCNDPSPAAKA